jgi:hypothetical protein
MSSSRGVEVSRRAFNILGSDRKDHVVFEDLKRVAVGRGEPNVTEREMHAMIDAIGFDGTGTVAKDTSFSIISSY